MTADDEEPLHHEEVFPQLGESIELKGRRGLIVGRTFNALSQRWSYLVRWADDSSTEPVYMSELMACIAITRHASAE